MNVLKYRVSLDMFDTHSQTTIKAKKSDSACQIHITLSEKGKIYNIGEGCSATFNARKSDGNFIYDNCTIENNTIVYDFTSSVDENGVCQVSACEGIVECEVTLYNADGKQLTSPRFTLFVDGTVYNGEEIASTPQSDFFKEIVAEAVSGKMDKFADVTVDRDGNVLLTPKKGLQIAANDDNGQVSLVGKYANLFADYINLHGSVSILGDLDFGYGDGKISNLGTPNGTDPTQAANVEFVKKARDMQLLFDHTITESETSVWSYRVTLPFPIDKYYIYIAYPANLDTSHIFALKGIDANNTSTYVAYLATNTGTKLSVFRGEKLGTTITQWDTEFSYFKPLLYNCAWQPAYIALNLGNIVAFDVIDEQHFVEGTKIQIWGRDAI